MIAEALAWLAEIRVESVETAWRLVSCDIRVVVNGRERGSQACLVAVV